MSDYYQNAAWGGVITSFYHPEFKMFAPKICQGLGYATDDKELAFHYYLAGLATRSDLCHHDELVERLVLRESAPLTPVEIEQIARRSSIYKNRLLYYSLCHPEATLDLFEHCLRRFSLVDASWAITGYFHQENVEPEAFVIGLRALQQRETPAPQLGSAMHCHHQCSDEVRLGLALLGENYYTAKELCV